MHDIHIKLNYINNHVCILKVKIKKNTQNFLLFSLLSKRLIVIYLFHRLVCWVISTWWITQDLCYCWRRVKSRLIFWNYPQNKSSSDGLTIILEMLALTDRLQTLGEISRYVMVYFLMDYHFDKKLCFCKWKCHGNSTHSSNIFR